MEHSKKVLIVGKNSYIGKNFIEYCNSFMNQDYVEGQDTHPYLIHAISGRDGEWKNTKFEGYDTVLLLSGIVHTNASKELYDEVNHKMAVEIAQKAKDAKVKQFIFMSTIAVYGDEIVWSGHQIKRNPKTPYAKSKQMAEDDIIKLVEDDFAVAIVQPPMVYGKNCPGNFPKLIKFIQKLHIFPRYQNQRSSIFILNLCEFLRVLVLRQCGGCYVPQNPQYLCTMDVAFVLKKKGVRVLLIPGCSGLIRLAGTLNSKVMKVFGDYQFPLDLSSFEQIEYQRYDVTDSIKLST